MLEVCPERLALDLDLDLALCWDWVALDLDLALCLDWVLCLDGDPLVALRLDWVLCFEGITLVQGQGSPGKGAGVLSKSLLMNSPEYKE